MSNSRFILWETETAVAYLISLGIAAWGICIVGRTIAAGSALAWTIAGLATVAIGAFSLFELFAHVNNAKPIKRGPLATGRDPMMGFRAAPALRAAIVKWAENQPDLPSLSEATRRLVELGLTVKEGRWPSNRQRLRAREMAGKAIDEMTDATATPDDRATRKKRLLKGPEEFREVRVDRPKSTS